MDIILFPLGALFLLKACPICGTVEEILRNYCCAIVELLLRKIRVVVKDKGQRISAIIKNLYILRHSPLVYRANDIDT